MKTVSGISLTRALLVLGLSAFAADTNVAEASGIVGEWETRTGQTTLYREDRTVDYRDCSVRFRVSPVTFADASMRIEELSARCSLPARSR